MKKPLFRKNKSSIFIAIFTLLLLGCGEKQPNIEGIWKTDFEDPAYIKLAGQLKYFVYKDLDALENNEFHEKGEYRFFEQNGNDCFAFGMFGQTSTPERKHANTYYGIIEYISDDNIIISKDESCLIAGWEKLNTDVDVDKANFLRIE